MQIKISEVTPDYFDSSRGWNNYQVETYELNQCSEPSPTRFKKSMSKGEYNEQWTIL